MQEKDDRATHPGKIRVRGGGSHYLLVPKAVREFLDLKDGDKIEIQVDNGKHGKYAAFWKEEE